MLRPMENKAPLASRKQRCSLFVQFLLSMDFDWWKQTSKYFLLDMNIAVTKYALRNTQIRIRLIFHNSASESGVICY